MFKKALLCVLYFSLLSRPVMAEEESATEIVNDYQYFLIEPDIITNYIKPGKRIGYIRVTLELMTRSKANYALLENNEPLIRDKIITVLGEQNEQQIKSTVDRDRIRQRCLDEINASLLAETGRQPIEDLLFTKYLYQ